MNLLASLSSEDKEYVLNLSHHLAYADMADELRQLLIDLDFAEYKLSISGVQSLIEDYDLAIQPEIHLARPTKKSFGLIQSALRLSANALTSDGQFAVSSSRDNTLKV